jgi:hypothetical protein
MYKLPRTITEISQLTSVSPYSYVLVLSAIDNVRSLGPESDTGSADPSVVRQIKPFSSGHRFLRHEASTRIPPFDDFGQVVN